jgi:hypothetical protein
MSQAKDTKSTGASAALAKVRKATTKTNTQEVRTITAEELANDILADVGESVTTLSMKKTQAATVQSDLLTVGNNHAGSSSKLNEIKVCDEKLSDFLIKKSDLEHQLAALERDMMLVTTRRDVLRSEYVAVSSQAHDKMSRLATAKAETERTDLLDVTVRSVTSSYATLDRNVRGIEEEICAILLADGGNAHGAMSAKADALDLSDISNKVALSRQAFCTYVNSEVACIESLTGRVVDLRNKQLQKNREISEYERIGIQVWHQPKLTNIYYPFIIYD